MAYGNKFLLKDYIYQTENFKIKENILLMGDSHAQYAFDNEQIKNSRNIAFRSEKYIWTYFKLKKILEAKKEIKKIFLTFSYHSTGKHNERELVDAKSRRFFYNRYFMLLDYDGVQDLEGISHFNSDLYIYNLKYQFGLPFETYKDWKLVPYIFLGENKFNQFSFSGYYQKEKMTDLSTKSLKKTLKRHFSSHYEPSHIQVKYFRKIQDLCLKSSVDLIVVTPPVHPKYFAKIPKDVERSYWHEILRLESLGIKTLNLSQLSLPDSNFKDFDHLNSKGAQVVSNILNKEMRF